MDSNDALMAAMMARRGGAPGGGPRLMPPEQQQMRQMVPIQGAAAPPSGDGMSAATRGLLDLWKQQQQKQPLADPAMVAQRREMMADALTGGMKPGVGQDGMGFAGFGGPR